MDRQPLAVRKCSAAARKSPLEILPCSPEVTGKPAERPEEALREGPLGTMSREPAEWDRCRRAVRPSAALLK